MSAVSADDPIVRQFRQIIVKAADGRLVRLEDVAKVELGARDYVTNSYLNGKPAVALGIYQDECGAWSSSSVAGLCSNRKVGAAKGRAHLPGDQMATEQPRRGNPTAQCASAELARGRSEPCRARAHATRATRSVSSSSSISSRRKWAATRPWASTVRSSATDSAWRKLWVMRMTACPWSRAWAM